MSKITVIKGDITKINADAIVNAANSSLLGGGAVDGAIHRAGGPAILEDCMKIRDKQGGCKTGEAVITTAGNLPAKFVIHTVGPIWNDDKDPAKMDVQLISCYRKSLILAVENQCVTIAFPNISTGIYHFPKDRAARLAIQTVQELLRQNEALQEVIFVCFDDENYLLYSGDW